MQECHTAFIQHDIKPEEQVSERNKSFQQGRNQASLYLGGELAVYIENSVKNLQEAS